MAQSTSNAPVKGSNSVKVSVARAAVKEVRVIDTDIVLVLDDGRKLFIRDGAVQTMVDNEFAVEFSDGSSVSGQELLQSAGSAEITPVAVSGPQDDGSATPVIAQLPQSAPLEVSAKPASSGGGIKTWLAIGTPLVGGIAGGVLGGGGSSSSAATGTQTNLNVKPATPVINVISGNDQINAADKAKGVEVKGSSEANANVTVIWGTVTKTATADASGIWTVTYATSEIPADALGTTVSATIKSSAGVSSDPASRTVQIDTTPPAVPTISTVASDNIVSPSEKALGVTVSGKAEPGSSVQITWGSETKVAQADQIGNWSARFAAEDIPSPGSSTISAKATDAFGNQGSESQLGVTISPAITITGQITAGPLVSSHGLTVDLLLKDGTTLATGVKADANGVFTATGLAAGVGDIVIARVNDTTAGADYDDEATGAAKDLNALFLAVTTVSGTSQSLNINPITTIAAIKAGLAADGSGAIASPTAVTEANAATAAAFGLAGIDLTTTRAVPTNTTSYNSTDGLSVGEKIGAVLAALSGVDKNNGGDAQATIAALSPLVETNGSAGTLLAQGQVTLMEGAVAAESQVPGGLQKIISDVVASSASSSNVSIGTIAEDNIVTAPEIADLTISGTVAAGATGVQLLFGSRAAAATINGETWTYKVTAADVSALGGDGPKIIQATATFADNSSLSTTRLISLKATPPALPSITQIANETADFAVNVAEKRDGFTATGTGEPGTTILVTFGTTTKSTTALANGTWTMSFAGLEIPATEGSVPFSVRARDSFGNVTEAVTQNVLIDTQAPTLLTFPRVGGDNLIGPGDTTSTRFEGTAEANALVNVVFNGNTYTGRAAANGAWSIPLLASRIPADGAYEVTATVFDAAGNRGVSVTQTLNVDVAPPSLPTIDAVAENDFVNKAERDSSAGVTVSGKAEAGTTVSIGWGGQSFSTKVNSRGIWSYTLFAAKSEIPVDSTGFITVFATDSSGNRSEIAKREVTVDTVSQGVSILSVSGDGRISLSDKNGTFIVEGVAEKGAFMTVTVGGVNGVGGMTETTNAAILDGKWSVTFNPSKYLSNFPADASDVIVRATARDIAGNISEAATLSVSVDTVVPSKPTINDVSTDNAINALEKQSSVEITGKAEPNSKVTIDWGSRVVGQVRDVDSNGDWKIVVSRDNIPDEGSADVIVRATDISGNVSEASDPRRVIIDTSTNAAFINTIATDNRINNAERLAGVSITGTAEAEGSVLVTIGSRTLSAPVRIDGGWTAIFEAGDLPGNGSWTVSVRAFDKFGNEASSARTAPFSVDLASEIPTFTGTFTPVSGIRAADNIVNNAERNAGITITGTGEVDGRAYVTINGLTLDGLVKGDGTWSVLFTKDQLPETLSGDVSVYVVDAAGNTSATITRPITIDTTAPGKPIFNAVAIDDRINRTERDSASGVDVTGKAEAGARVYVTWGEGGLQKFDDADADGNWEVNFLGTEMNAGGTTQIFAYQVDAAGNVGEPETRTVTVATGAPPQPVIDLTILGGDNRVNNAEFVTVPGMVISGTGVAGNKVVLSWGSFTSSEVPVGPGGAWSLEVPGSAVTTEFDTTTTISVRQIDGDGNISAPAMRTITIDRTAPIGGAITSQPGPAQNDNKTINIEEKAAGLILSGTAAPDAAQVRISWTANGAAKSFDVAAVDGSGGKIWTFPVPNGDLPTASANTVFSVRSIDAAGNVGIASSVTYIFDLSAPAAPISASFGGTDNIVSTTEANVSSGTNIVVSGGLANNHGASKVVVSWTFDGNTYSQETPVLAAATTWSLNWNKANLPSADGTYSATAQTVDGAGNVSAAVPINFTVDRGIPSVLSFTSIGAGGDYVINIAENTADTLDVRGTGGAVGATVYLTIGASATVVGSSPVGEGGTWTIPLQRVNYPSADTVFNVYQILPNTNRSDTVSQPVTLDLSPPPTPVITAPSGFTFATDNRINNAERPSGLSLSGTAAGGANKILLTWTTGSTDYSEEVPVSGGEWTASIASGKLPSGNPNSSITISARAIDAAGNQSVGVAQQSYIFDTSAPTAVTTVSFATDNVVNLKESELLTLNFTGNLAANHGAKKIIIVWNGQTESIDLANETSAVTGWTIPWSRLYLPSSPSSTAQIFTEDAAGNRSAAVDRVVTNNRTPAAPLTNVVVATDGKINLEESIVANITVTGGGASVGSTVFVTLGGVTRNTSTIGGDGTWTITIPTTSLTFTTSSLALSAYQTNAQGNDSAPVTQTVGVDTAPPAVLTLNDVTPGDSINAVEAGQTITLTGATDPGITSVTVAWGGGTPKNAVVTTTGSTANWSASFSTAERSALVDGTPVRITVVAADDYGNTKTTFRDIVVDTSPPTGLTVDTGLAADGVNIADAATGVIISGVAENSAQVVVDWNGRIQSTTANAETGNWSVTYGTNRDSAAGIPYDGAAVNLTVTQTDGRGNSQSITQNIRIDTIAPVAPSLLGMSNDYGLVGDYITSRNSTTLVGQAGAGDDVSISVGGLAPVIVKANSRGIWTYSNANLNLASVAFGGSVAVTGRSFDSANNSSGAPVNLTSVQRQAVTVTPIELGVLQGTATPGLLPLSASGATQSGAQISGIYVYGTTAGDRLGSAVATGDVDGDGNLDLILGARGADNINLSDNTTTVADVGEVNVIYGRASNNWTGVTAIDTQRMGNAGYAVRGESVAAEGFGMNVTFLGDVNNDNRGDIAVMAWGGDNGAVTDVGSVYVLFSPASRNPGVQQTNATSGADKFVSSVSTMTKDSGFIFRGLVSGDRTGQGLVGAQLNKNDTFADIAIGIPNYDRTAASGLTAQTDVGAVAIIFGRSDGNYTSGTGKQELDINSLVAPGSLAAGAAGAEGFLIRGNSESGTQSGDSLFGYSIAKGDFNGDGTEDLMIGSPNFEPLDSALINPGAVYVIYGKATKAAWDAILTDDPSRTAPSGAARVLDVSTLTTAPANGYRITGEQQGNGSIGISVRSAGDVNGDGIEDMIMGSTSWDLVVGSVGNSGTAFVVFGKTGQRSNLDLATLSAADGFIIRGVNLGDAAGNSVAGVGDVNGDGYGDIVVTVPGQDRTGLDWGYSYLILGKGDGSIYGSLAGTRSILNLNEFSPGDGVVFVGRAAGSALGGGSLFQGTSVTAAGDLNKDGFADFILTANASGANGRGNAGEAYVIFGSAGLGGLTLTGTATPDNLVGGTFNDTLSGGGGLDNILGFAGNDTITVPDLGFNFIDGGAGIDTLRLTGSGDILNVRSSGGANNALTSGQVAGIERIDLTGAGNNTLQIDANGLLQLSQDLFAGGSGADRLIVTGDTGDRVDALGFGTSSTGSQVLNGITYNIYSGTGTSGAAAQLWVQQGVTYQVLAA